MIGWQPHEPITCESRVHRKGGGVYDSSVYHFIVTFDFSIKIFPPVIMYDGITLIPS